MEHKPCSCGCCRESSLAPHETKAVDLFAGVQLFYLPEAAVCRRGREGGRGPARLCLSPGKPFV